ncbi:universal stress protein [Mycobacterium sp. NPDC048908]|uniref:universal stress protein n=1 Tax=Mycobacterium sp. NPDC048908 TaxID=3364292 RepID=UPI003710EA5D
MSGGSPTERKPIVVGIDGSPASLNAAKWAVAEAVARDAPLRLIHAVRDHNTACEADPLLLTAADVIDEAGHPVCLEVKRVVGDPGEVLIAESCHAAMVCLGEPAPDPSSEKLFGATAIALLEHARCPVAVIRSDSEGLPRDRGVVSVVLDDEPDNDAVVHLAMQEGRLRKATVRQIDRRVGSWIRRYPDVHVEVVASGTGWRYGRTGNEADGTQLAVVGDSDADQIGTLAVPNCHPILDYPDCSVLMVRN